MKEAVIHGVNFSDIKTTVFDEVLKGLNQFKNSTSHSKTFFEWAIKIGYSRIDHIVSNKHRKAYARVASVLGALSECYVLLDQKDQAKSLVDEFYFDKYNRYPAFRREVKSIFASSKILAGMRI